ncbi:hypothetical protein D7Z26_22305 [Cohnella endophytica]|uniref:Uncharacterized protein n=1 Tax=Cohnella endophytica TaxID=2419778 RepID=A0A494XK64_9BACL|nr:hypothetical protein [Cohnella endophytica]RKP47943.1 hypothetical protein D7Z26_22305 [Cohnella endophytica]
MTENNTEHEDQAAAHQNQFLDPPIKPHDRSDEPEVEAEMTNDDDMLGNVEKQADGYKSICRE